MGVAYNPQIVTNGLVLCLDAANTKSYPGSGTTWTDLSGSGNTGTLVNGVGYDVDSLSFDGVNDYISVPYNSILNTPNGATYSIWIYPTSTGEFLNRGTSDSGATPDNPRFYINVSSKSIYFDWSTPGSDRYLDTSSNSFESNKWINVVGVAVAGGRLDVYVNGSLCTYQSRVNADTMPNPLPNTNNEIQIGGVTWVPRYFGGRISSVQLYNRALTASEIQQNYNALKSRNLLGSILNPFTSPVQAQTTGYPAGTYYFKSGAMSTAQLLEYQPNYYESRPFCCVFRSPYRSTATTNKIDLNIPMGGLLVQRDVLDLRAAVYWSTPITYNTVGGAGNNTADSGYSPRRVILGNSGGHGIFATNQQQCNWGTATGAIGAGWDGSTCGSFPNDLVWGTGRSDTATYENRSGTWSHWITWN